MSEDRPLRGFVVLVVDDDADNREAAAMIIRELGCDVLEVSSSGEALQVLTSDATSISCFPTSPCRRKMA